MGIGLGGREEGAYLLALKVAAFRSWRNSLHTPGESTYVGPETDIALPYGITLGWFQRVGGPGGYFSFGIVRAF